MVVEAYSSMPSRGVFNLQSEFSLFSWVYLTSYGKGTSYEERIIAKDNVTTNNRCFNFVTSGPADTGNVGKLRFVYNVPDNISIYSTSTVGLNSWHYVGIVSTQGTYTFYIDGVASGTGSTNITPAYQGTAPLALRSIPNDQYVESIIGYQDEVGIWSRAKDGTNNKRYNNGNGLTY